MSMHHDCRIIIFSCALICFSHLYSNNKNLWIMWCTDMLEMPYLVSDGYVLLGCVMCSLALLSRWHWNCLTLFVKKMLFVSSKKKDTPTLNNLVVSKWNPKKIQITCLCWCFLALVCCTIGNTPAQLIEPIAWPLDQLKSPCALVV
jgi:hypothetical protein